MGLVEDPFSYRVTKAGQVRISRGGRVVVVVSGGKAAKLISELGENDEQDQELLARATGNYRRGNERHFR